MGGGAGEGGQDIEELPETLSEAEPESAEPPEVGGVGGGVTEDGEADDDAGNADTDDSYLS